MDSFFVWVADHYINRTPLALTMIQGFIWSLADILLIFGILRMASLVRARYGMKRTRIRYVFFGLIVILNPILVFFMPGKSHDLLLLGLFSLMIYVIVVDGNRMLRFARQIVSIGGRD